MTECTCTAVLFSCVCIQRKGESLDLNSNMWITEQCVLVRSQGNCTRRFLFLLDDDDSDDDSDVKRRKAACGRTRRYRERIRQQQRKSHVPQKYRLFAGEGGKKSSYTCRKCGLNWNEGSEFGYHMKEVHKRPIYLCTYENCDKVFIRRDSQKYHLMEHEGKYTFNCDICGKGFFHKSHYEGHVNVHTNRKPYSCEKCNKGFSYLSDHIRHSKICGAESNIKCDLCDKTFTSGAYLSNHVKFYHRMGDPKYCPVCNREFYYASSYNTHVKSHYT